jgi:DNA-binding MarR family transcriptional regulator
MSTALNRAARSRPIEGANPPFVGALLRLCWQRARRRIVEAIRAEGFTDLQDAHLVALRYPPPDRVRPSALARQLGMSRQATNYIVAQLEELGYLERRAGPGGARRLIYLTPRGWRVVETIHACMRGLQAEWAAKVGQKRFDVLMAALRELAADEEEPAD